MLLAIDARPLTSRPTGVAQFLLAAVNVWSELQPGWTFVLLAHKPLHAASRAALTAAGNVRFEVRPAPSWPDNGLWWLMRQFEPAARAVGADLLWGSAGVLPPLRRLPALLTVHDLVYLELSATMSWRTRTEYALLASRAVRSAEWLWCVSDYTAREVAARFPTYRALHITKGSGLNPLRTGQQPDMQHLEVVRARFCMGERTLLFVGTLEPRKNLGFLLSMMPALAARGYTLCVVGCSGWGRSGVAEVVEQPGFPRQAVMFCDFVSDADLQALYCSSHAFISTSLMEGFGLPHLEAMAAGCPVVAAANSATVEVVGNGGVLVSGWEPQAWIDAIEHVSAHSARWSSAAREAAHRHDIAKPCEELSTAIRAGMIQAELKRHT